MAAPTPPFHDDAQIHRVVLRFLDRSLPAGDWSHAAHFCAAFALLADPARDAFAEMPGLIRAYNEACGNRNTDDAGYHETITLASLRAGRAWLAARPGVPLHEALNALLLASPYGKSDWLLGYWSRDRLFSPAARRRWLEPDLAALPF